MSRTGIPVQFRLPPETVAHMDAACAALGITRTAYVDAAIMGAEVRVVAEVPRIKGVRVGRPKKGAPVAAPTGARDGMLSPADTREALEAMRKPSESWEAFAIRIGRTRATVTNWLHRGMSEETARGLGLEPREGA